MVDENGSPLVFDTTALCHFAIADRIDVLGSRLSRRVCLTTNTVIEELKRGLPKHPQLAAVFSQRWLAIEGTDSSIARLTGFAKWVKRIGSSSDRDLGEASVIAVAEEPGATAIIDDHAAKRVAKQHYKQVHGTLWLLAELWREKQVTEVEVSNLVDLLLDSGMRLPCRRNEFAEFVRKSKMGPYRR